MADFLASFNFGAQNDVSRDNEACASLYELQERLRRTVAEKTTEVRAERVNTMFDIAGTAEFSIMATPASAQKNNNADAVDPSLQGAEPMDVDVDVDMAVAVENEAPPQVYSALTVLTSQPSVNPSIQQNVATQIVDAASAADSSSWILYHSELKSSGWTFTFLCAGSTTVWKMQNQSKVKAVVGDFSKRDADPVLMSRPAFDCRGRLTISFPRKERKITVRYDHTPLHMTVADHMEFTKPPPMIGPQKPSKAILMEATRQAQREAASAKKKAYRLAKKQEAREAREAAIRNGTAPPKPQRSRKKKEREAAQLLLADQASRALEDAGVIQLQQAISREEGTNGDAGGQAAASTERPASKALALNVSPEEAARRMDVALNMLAEAGIDHTTLSADQLTIFANQAPDLQKESLNMLITYGAERLQIIHPSNREHSNSAPPPAVEQASAAEDKDSSGSATTTTQLALGGGTPARKGKSRPLGKSRLACFQCKSRKVKTAGHICKYPPQPVRRRKTLSDAVVAEGGESANVDADADADADAEGEEEKDDGEETLAEATMTGTRGADDDNRNHNHNHDEINDDGDYHDDEDGDDGEEHGPLQHGSQDEQSGVDAYPADQYSSYPPAPISDLFSNAPGDPVHGVHERPSSLPYFQSASGLSLPQPDPLDEVPRSHLSSGLALPQSTVYYPMYNATAPSLPSAAEVPQEREETPFQQETRASTVHQQARQSSHGGGGDVSSSSAWGQDTGLPAKTATPQISPPIRHSTPKASSPDQVAAATLHRNQLQDAHLLAHAATSNQRYTPNSSVKMQHIVNHTPANKSPFQPMYTSRSKSQQGHRDAASLSQRSSSAFQVPTDPLGNGSTNNNNNHTSNSNSSSNSNSHNKNSSGNNNESTAAGTAADHQPNHVGSSSSSRNSLAAGRLPTSGQAWSRHSGSTSILGEQQPDKIGYKPYSYQKSTSTGGGYPSYSYDGSGTTAMALSGAYDSLTAQGSSWSDNRGQIPVDGARAAGYQHQGHQSHQSHHHQSHQSHQQAQAQAQQSQQRHTSHQPQPVQQTHQSHPPQPNHQNHQQSQTWQGLSSQHSNALPQLHQRHGFDWGLHDSWGRGH
ncbi:hypothetical protein E4U42_004123 [Claviceps africana]|uniref:Uncharacterized protein n=1 Tax=Claviceps africana TaxID=83212 RepID=A0A8K0NH92_9HYPO|nr:hypothetical protein E4U42_004123 [Claviceps africana]